jgi:BCL2-associated athanogene 3
MEVPRKSSGSSAKDESIPIRVFHEKHNPGEKHKYTSHNKTADLPASNNDNSSPRVTRAHSEPPKHFNQSQRPNLKTKIPLGNLAENSEHNLSTSASDPSVPSTEQPQQHQQQPNEQQQPAVRHIPIFVEGRDKPVINDEGGIKKPSEFYPSNVKVERRAQNPPTSLNVHNLKDKKQEPTSPLSPIPSDQPIPMGYTETDNAINGQPQEPTSPQPMPAGPIPMPCSPNFMNKKEASPPPPAPPQRQPQRQPQPPKLDPKDPSLQQLFKIQDNVNELVNQLDEFNGDKNSKEFKYLDEMLTRNLIALDEIESGGRPDVRQARKESINAINRCLSVLEAKAKSPDAARNNEILSELATKSSQQ